MSEKTTTRRDKLIAAARLVQQGWTQRALARGSDGKNVKPTSPDAVAWSAMGALIACSPDDHGATLMMPLGRALGTNGRWQTIELWNNNPARTGDEVAGALERASALAGET